MYDDYDELGATKEGAFKHEALQQMSTNHKVKTYKKEDTVGSFQRSTSIAINEVQGAQGEKQRNYATNTRC
jgi:predicted transcriptional regulator